LTEIVYYFIKTAFPKILISGKNLWNGLKARIAGAHVKKRLSLGKHVSEALKPE
jgi:hypothetical protein